MGQAQRQAEGNNNVTYASQQSISVSVNHKFVKPLDERTRICSSNK